MTSVELQYKRIGRIRTQLKTSLTHLDVVENQMEKDSESSEENIRVAIAYVEMAKLSLNNLLHGVIAGRTDGESNQS